MRSWMMAGKLPSDAKCSPGRSVIVSFFLSFLLFMFSTLSVKDLKISNKHLPSRSLCTYQIQWCLTPPTSSAIGIDTIDMKGGGGKTRPGLRSASQKSGKIKLKNMKTRCEYVFIFLSLFFHYYLQIGWV